MAACIAYRGHVGPPGLAQFKFNGGMMLPTLVVHACIRVRDHAGLQHDIVVQVAPGGDDLTIVRFNLQVSR